MNKSVSPARYGCLRLFGAQAFLASDQYSLGSLDFDRNRKSEGLAQKETTCASPVVVYARILVGGGQASKPRASRLLCRVHLPSPNRPGPVVMVFFGPTKIFVLL
jgi:hypothetical protein